MKVLNIILAIVFFLFAALQYNDPDPFRWTALYGFVGAVCLFAAFGRYNRPALWIGVAACLIWLAILFPDFLNWIKIGTPNIAGEMKTEEPHVELTREFLGVGVCLTVLGWHAWRVREK